MGKTRLASGLGLGALVAIALLWAGSSTAASNAHPGAEEAAPPAGEPLTINWIERDPHPIEGLLLKVEPEDAEDLGAFFERQGFGMAGVRAGARSVPRVAVTRLPQDLKALRRAEERKLLFLRSVLPLVLLSNEEIRTWRGRLLALQEAVQAGAEPAPEDRAWLAEMAERYGSDPQDLDALLRRVDEVPVSLALGQTILESGWGTSRLAIEGNALFGETTPSTAVPHLVQRVEGGKRFRAFPSLLESVRAYMHNLNSHPAYRRFREQRAAQRALGVMPSGKLLLPTLERYAELPQYLKLVRSLIRSNGLEELESARLDRDWFASRDASF
ncbi:MAG: glucosaminidase domain-containing protein [Tistlia sp.]|uniref:glucosaminidase domain-containing protein n=1 Tax=Tistlia sp. TaxID=3057121 RepID=UPI0034A5504A